MYDPFNGHPYRQFSSSKSRKKYTIENGIMTEHDLDGRILAIHYKDGSQIRIDVAHHLIMNCSAFCSCFKIKNDYLYNI
jgi:hypothetical protein